MPRTLKEFAPLSKSDMAAKIKANNGQAARIPATHGRSGAILAMLARDNGATIAQLIAGINKIAGSKTADLAYVAAWLCPSWLQHAGQPKTSGKGWGLGLAVSADGKRYKSVAPGKSLASAWPKALKPEAIEAPENEPETAPEDDPAAIAA